MLSRRLSTYNQSKLNTSDLDLGSKSVDIKSASKAPAQEVKTSAGFFSHGRPFGESKAYLYSGSSIGANSKKPIRPLGGAGELQRLKQ